MTMYHQLKELHYQQYTPLAYLRQAKKEISSALERSLVYLASPFGSQYEAPAETYSRIFNLTKIPVNPGTLLQLPPAD